MRKEIYLTAITIVIVALSIWGQGKMSSSPANEKSLNNEVTLPNSKSGLFMRSAFKIVMNDSQVPSGIAITSGCDPEQKHIYKPMNKTLRATLNAIIEADPKYRWSMADGVVNLLPQNNNDVALLNVRIPQFQVKKGESIYDALNYLLQKPEFGNAAMKLDLGPAIHRGGIYSPSLEKDGYNLKTPINLKDVSVREVLNAIVRSHGKAEWFYNQWRCGERHEFSVEVRL